MSVISRASWGHPGPVGAAMSLPAQRLFVHHSVTPAQNGTAAVRQVANIGIQRFGRSSYSYACTLDGKLYELQGTHVGAHTAGYNSSSLAVVLVGNYDNTNITTAQINAIGWLYRWLRSNGRLVPGASILGHRDVGSTACPGSKAYAALPRIRNVAFSGSPVAPTPPPKPKSWLEMASKKDVEDAMERVLTKVLARGVTASRQKSANSAWWQQERTQYGHVLAARKGVERIENKHNSFLVEASDRKSGEPVYLTSSFESLTELEFNGPAHKFIQDLFAVSGRSRAAIRIPRAAIDKLPKLKP